VFLAGKGTLNALERLAKQKKPAPGQTRVWGQVGFELLGDEEGRFLRFTEPRIVEIGILPGPGSVGPGKSAGNNFIQLGDRDGARARQLGHCSGNVRRTIPGRHLAVLGNNPSLFSSSPD
jgi:hypothetical protein